MGKSTIISLVAALVAALVASLLLSLGLQGPPGVPATQAPPAAQDPEPEEPLPVRPAWVSADRWVPVLRFALKRIDGDSALRFARQLRQLDAQRPRGIVVELNTPGGVVSAAYEMIRAIETARAPVRCVVDGEAESAGFMLLQACPIREMTWRSVLMVHQPYVNPGTDGVREHQAWNLWQDIHATGEAMLQIEGRRMVIGVDGLRKMVADGKEWYMTAPGAVLAGAVDQVVPSVESVVVASSVTP